MPRVTRRGLGVLAASLAFAALHTTWGIARGLVTVPLGTAIVVALVMGGLLALAWPPLRRHVAAARAGQGPYARRHAGLIFAVLMWSTMTFRSAIRESGSGALEERLWLFLGVGSATAFIYLWGGLFFGLAMTRVDPGSRKR